MRPGDSVRHPELGAGTIVEVHARGGHIGARVNFGYLTDWVPATELGIDLVSFGPSRNLGDASPEEATPTATLSDAVVNARRGVLALKLGQVLEQHVLQLSTGTETVQGKLETIVSRAMKRQAQAVLVEGAWGSGKTHLLTMLRAIATSTGMATASVILDGDDVRLSEPMRLMAAVLESLRYPGEAVPGGIGGRLGQLRRSVIPWNLRSRGARRIAEVVGLLPVEAFDEPEILEILEGYLMLSLPATQARTALLQHGYRGVPLPWVRLFFIEDFSPYSWALLPADASPQWPFREGHQAGQRVPASFRQPAEPRHGAEHLRSSPRQARSLLDIRAAFWYGAVGREADLRWL